MPKKVISGTVGTSTIRFENTWFNGATLFIDDELVTTCHDLVAVSWTEPVMSIVREIDGLERRVEVFVAALFRVRIQINVDGVKIAGDDVAR